MSLILPQQFHRTAPCERMEQNIRTDLNRHSQSKHLADIFRALDFQIALQMGNHGRNSRPTKQFVQLINHLVVPGGERQFQQKIPGITDTHSRQFFTVAQIWPPGYLGSQKHPWNLLLLPLGHLQYPPCQRGRRLLPAAQKPLRIFPVTIEMRGQHHGIHTLTAFHAQQRQTVVHSPGSVINTGQDMGMQICHAFSSFCSSLKCGYSLP